MATTMGPRTGRLAADDATAVHYVEWGGRDAPPVVLLHGLRAYGHWFEEFAEAAGDRYRVIAPDLRGRGESGWARDGDYSTDAYVADLERLVLHLGLERFALGGHSLGGVVAAHHAARHPEQVRALMILEMSPEVHPTGLARIKRELAETPSEFPSWDDARAFLRRLHARASPRSLETRRRWMLRETATGSIGWRLDPAVMNPSRAPDPASRTWAALEAVKCPALVVRGALSDIVTRDTCATMVAVMPQSRWIEVPDAGHMVLEDNPAACSAALLDFLAAAA
jgi:pimeloyl-ACP methyl ester carboxylesterase